MLVSILDDNTDADTVTSAEHCDDIKIWLNIQDFLPQKPNKLVQNLSYNSAELYFL